jgi:hypothetical protein
MLHPRGKVLPELGRRPRIWIFHDSDYSFAKSSAASRHDPMNALSLLTRSQVNLSKNAKSIAIAGSTDERDFVPFLMTPW